MVEPNVMLSPTQATLVTARRWAAIRRLTAETRAKSFFILFMVIVIGYREAASRRPLPQRIDFPDQGGVGIGDQRCGIGGIVLEVLLGGFGDRLAPEKQFVGLKLDAAGLRVFFDGAKLSERERHGERVDAVAELGGGGLRKPSLLRLVEIGLRHAQGPQHSLCHEHVAFREGMDAVHRQIVGVGLGRKRLDRVLEELIEIGQGQLAVGGQLAEEGVVVGQLLVVRIILLPDGRRRQNDDLDSLRLAWSTIEVMFSL